MIKVLLIFLIACFGYSDYFTGKSLQTRPLVLGPLVGLAMGDLQTGCVIGATMELQLLRNYTKQKKTEKKHWKDTWNFSTLQYIFPLSY